jgi:hypothetical protein
VAGFDLANRTNPIRTASAEKIVVKMASTIKTMEVDVFLSVIPDIVAIKIHKLKAGKLYRRITRQLANHGITEARETATPMTRA